MNKSHLKLFFSESNVKAKPSRLLSLKFLNRQTAKIWPGKAGPAPLCQEPRASNARAAHSTPARPHTDSTLQPHGQGQTAGFGSKQLPWGEGQLAQSGS